MYKDRLSGNLLLLQMFVCLSITAVLYCSFSLHYRMLPIWLNKILSSCFSSPLFLYLLLLLHKPVDVYSVFSNSGGSGFWQCVWMCLLMVEVGTTTGTGNLKGIGAESIVAFCWVTRSTAYFWMAKDTDWKQSRHSPVIQFCKNCRPKQSHKSSQTWPEKKAKMRLTQLSSWDEEKLRTVKILLCWMEGYVSTWQKEPQRLKQFCWYDTHEGANPAGGKKELIWLKHVGERKWPEIGL